LVRTPTVATTSSPVETGAVLQAASPYLPPSAAATNPNSTPATNLLDTSFPPSAVQLLAGNAGAAALPPSSFVPVGGVDGAVTGARAPRAVETDTLAPSTVAPAPLPRDAGSAPSEQTPADSEIPALAPVGTSLATSTPETDGATLAEQPEALGQKWGWIGAAGAVLAAGGYWMLRRAQIARLTNRWAGKRLPSGTILSTDLDAA
jgi:hypothetical protein